MGIIILIAYILSILFKIKGYPNLKKRIYKIIINKEQNEIIKTKIKNNPIKRPKIIKINLMNENEKNSKSWKTSKNDMITKHSKTQIINNNKKKNIK